MKTARTDDETSTPARNLSSATGSHRRTLEAMFHDPEAHRLEWRDVVALIADIGDVREKTDSEFVLEVAGQRHTLLKSSTKDLTISEVIGIRHFLEQAGFSPQSPSRPPAHPDPASPGLLILVNHHETKIFRVDVMSDDTSEYLIRPPAAHTFLHRLVHKDQSDERGQRAAEEPAYYEAIANAVALRGKMVVVGQGTENSNAAHHLTKYLKANHRETYRRIVGEFAADLSCLPAPQILDLARQTLIS